MKKQIRLLLYVIPAAALLFFGIQQGESVKLQSTRPLADLMLTPAGTPTAGLVKVLELMPLPEFEGRDLAELSLSDLVPPTQKQWLRPANAERWDLRTENTERDAQLLTAFDQLGMFKEIAPTKKQYTYCLVLGASAPNMRKRIEYLITLWQQGVRFDQLVFLGGERPLDPKIESSQVLLDTSLSAVAANLAWQPPATLPTTETGMMKLLWDQVAKPEDLAAMQIIFIDTPMQQKPDGSLRRPTTGDTITSWLLTNPKKGSVLFISQQPYCIYQDSVVRTSMPTEFYIDTCAQKGIEENINVLKDNLARMLYQEKLRREKALSNMSH